MEQHRLKFSDFAKDTLPIEGEKVQLDSILNREIYITEYRIKPTKYEGKNKSGKYLTLQFERDGATGPRCIAHTGSDVLIDQMERYGDRVPFLATVVKIGRYYTLT